MNRIIFIILLPFCFALASQAQNTYSLENLEKLSQNELSFYKDKAYKLQKTGKIVTTVGAVTFGTSALVLLFFHDQLFYAAILPVFAGALGILTLTVGIPIRAVGKKRVKRINSIQKTAFNTLCVDIEPGAQYNLMTKSYQPAITLRLRF